MYQKILEIKPCCLILSSFPVIGMSKLIGGYL